MAVTVKKVVLWRGELANRPGTLAETLKPLVEAKVNLQVAMGYRFPADHSRAAVEVYPIAGSKAEKAAQEAGLHPMETPCLLVQGDDRIGLGYKTADSLSSQGINIDFVVTQTIGNKYGAIFGFETQEDADNAIAVIKRTSLTLAPKKGAAKKKASGKKGAKKPAKKPAKKAASKKGAAKKSTKKGGAKSAVRKGAAKKKSASKGKSKKK